MLVPKLRFKREDGSEYPEWNKDKWSCLGDFVGSGTLSKSDLSDNGIPCILYGELYTKYGEIARTIFSKTNSNTHTFSKADDVILPKSGETPEDISTATCIPYDNISLGGDLIVFRHNEKVIGSYLSYLISNRAKNAIASIAQGKSVVHINEKFLSNIELPYPEIEEQQKIADFLSAVDEVIAQSEMEVQNLEQQKKAAMQKIFSQEVRFKREDGSDYPEWEEKTLKEMDFYISDGNYGELYPKANELIDCGVPFIRVNSFTDGYLSHNELKYISPELHNILISGHLKTADILITTRGQIGLVAYVDEAFNNANINAQICLIRTNGKMVEKYLHGYLQSPYVQKEILKLQTGTALKQLPRNKLDLLSIKYPCLEEQQKIADFLSAYDEAICYAKQELEHWKMLKKGLLQQMFV